MVTICTASLTFNNSTFCPHSVFMCFYNRDSTPCSPVVTICTASLTFNNSTFCPHSVFMCFVWISQQTAIISLYNINWLVFVTRAQIITSSSSLPLTVFVMLFFRLSLKQGKKSMHIFYQGLNIYVVQPILFLSLRTFHSHTLNICYFNKLW